MTDKERWKIQNRLYRMKDRKLELELHLKEITKFTNILFGFSFLSKRNDESFLPYLIEVVSILFCHLDKVFDFYYLKTKSFLTIKKIKKEIKTLTQEIQLYEYKL
jgi:hypothetical protein